MDMPSVQLSYFALQGGLNLVTPPLSMPDGMCRSALNFEVDIDSGYRRIAGYERYDGRTQPSDGVFYSIYCTFSDTVNVGDTITGLTSGATGYVIAVTAEYIVFTKLTGNFVSGEDLQVSGVTKAVSTGVALQQSAPSLDLETEYRKLSANAYRADITPVPGSGSILGVWRYNNTVYAFRNDLSGTEACMYKSSPAGWVKVDLGYEVAFSNANTSVQDGDTLTQGAVTAVIRRVVVETGSLVSGVNTGRLILDTPAGGAFAAGAATSTGGGALTLSGASAAISLLTGGNYEFVNYNFGGSANTTKMYGCSASNKAFEFDGTVYVPISTGMVTDRPSHIAAHNNYLFLSFEGSIQYSAVGNPYVFSVVVGAGEIAMGDTVTGFLPLVGGETSSALAVFTTNRTSILYDDATTTFRLVSFSFESGAYPRTMQQVGAGYVLDELGIRQITPSDTFGNFAQGQISNFIRPYINERVTRSMGSCVVRLRNQYRVFFNDSTAIYVTFDNGRIKGLMPMQFAHTMTCVSSSESSGGEEYIMAGDTSGYVYRMERGTSFDGSPIVAFMNLSFSFMKNPRMRKRYRKAVYEVTGARASQFFATYELGYGSSEIDQGLISTIAAGLGSTFWDSFVWDSFFWDGRTLLPAEHDLTGTAENISLIIRSESDLYDPFVINSAIIQYTQRRQLR